MIDMPPGWTPQPHTNIDPNLYATLDDIKNHEETKAEYIEEITNQLKECYDPEISIDIYNLGLIYDVKVTEERYVFVLMSLTSAFCPAADMIPLDVQQKILKKYPENIPEWIISNYDNLLTTCVKK